MSKTKVKFTCNNCGHEFSKKIDVQAYRSHGPARKRPVFSADCPKCGEKCFNTNFPFC